MATTISTSLSLSVPIFPFNSHPYHFLTIHRSFPPPSSSITPFSQRILLAQNPIQRKRKSLPTLHATPEESLASEATNLVEKSQEIASTGDDSVSTVVSALLFVAFIGLSILTVGIIYIAVTDFLQKREKEKFEKEEVAEKKKGKKKKKVRARAGPKGFGQKIEEEEEDEV